jgi:uncharacterized membrane protein
MYSKVKIASHPVHVMLVAFPVALYTAALVCFAAYALGAETFWFRVGVWSNLAGVVTAAVAAVPGFIDWAFGIPSGTPAKGTGLAHMGFNVCALLVFAVNAAMQWPHRADVLPPVGMSVVLTALGLVLTVCAGFLGWKLVQTHHVGVDLTPEQQRYEPRPTARGERVEGPMGHQGHKA